MTRGEAAKLVAIVMGAYPSQAVKLGEDIAEAMVSSYAVLLDDIPYATAQAALRALSQIERFMPSVADIRAACIELTKGPRRHGVDAWGDVIAMRSYRDVSAIRCFDQIALHVCREFGWLQLRTLWRGEDEVEQWHVSHSENESADRARFIELYDKLTAQGHREAVAPVLAEARQARERGLSGDPFRRALDVAARGKS